MSGVVSFAMRFGGNEGTPCARSSCARSRDRKTTLVPPDPLGRCFGAESKLHAAFHSEFYLFFHGIAYLCEIWTSIQIPLLRDGPGPAIFRLPVACFGGYGDVQVDPLGVMLLLKRLVRLVSGEPKHNHSLAVPSRPVP